MKIINTLESLRHERKLWAECGQAVALVPTMGALHAGHMALVKAAHKLADRVVLSIYVNPKQFGKNEDLSRYPRTIEADTALCTQYGVDAIWLPENDIMYPENFATHISALGAAQGLCGNSRQGHFDGVALVVVKLCNQVAPDVIIFGEKDYQQCTVVKQTLRDLNMDIAIHTVATKREADGLAMSSRNRYLTEAERAIAPYLYQTLRDLKGQIEEKAATQENLKRAQDELIEEGFSAIEYLELREAQTLTMLTPETYEGQAARLLIAGKLGNTRLIDNIPVGASNE